MEIDTKEQEKFKRHIAEMQTELIYYYGSTRILDHVLDECESTRYKNGQQNNN